MLQFAILGLGSGAIFALVAQGLVVVYRGSGILNFSQAGLAVFGAYLFHEFYVYRHWQYAAAFVTAVAATALLGALVHLLVMRQLRNAAPLVKTIATLGVLAVVQGAAVLRYGGQVLFTPGALPSSRVSILGTEISQDRLWLVAIAGAVTLAMYLVTRYSLFGIAMSAVAEDQKFAAALGWSPDRVAAATWAIGGALAAVAGILVVPIIGLTVTSLTVVALAAMAAALIGNFANYWLTFGGALLLGVLQSEATRYITQPGAGDAVPFVVILLVLMIRGRALTVRGALIERLPSVGAARSTWKVILGFLAVGIVLITWLPEKYAIAMTAQLAVATVLLSIVVLTGYCGQISLAQLSIAGLGAFICGRLVASAGLPLAAALPVGVIGAGALGAVFGLPALRTRGISLAILTLGLGITLQQLIFTNFRYIGGAAGTPVGAARLLGVDLDPILLPRRYGIFCLVAFVVAVLVVSNVRRSRSGRRMLAIRSNENAAASLGINVTAAKLYAFAVSSALAGLGGILLGFQNYTIVYSRFSPAESISAIGNTVLGGLGYVSGSVVGSGFAPGGAGDVALNDAADLGKWLPLISGILLLITVMMNPDGVVGGFVEKLHHASQRRSTRRAKDTGEDTTRVSPADDTARQRVRKEGHALEVTGLSVRYGGVAAVQNVSLSVRSGELVGLIGPNGAGKTTVLDALTGFAPRPTGSVRLDGHELTGVAPYVRARLGLVRSFQSSELFDDLTVLENLQVGSDPGDGLAYLTNLVVPDNRPLAPVALAAIREFQLEPHLGVRASRLPYGARRLVGIARGLATDPHILLLDEPAAGLDELETRELGKLLKVLTREWGIGILLVEHDVNLVMDVCDRIVVVDAGAKIADGAPADVRQNETVIEAYLGV